MKLAWDIESLHKGASKLSDSETPDQKNSYEALAAYGEGRIRP